MKFKQPVYLIVDVLLVSMALCLAFMLRFGLHVPLTYINILLFILPLAILTKIAIFFVFGLYGHIWQYASLKEALRLFRGISVASLIFLGLLFFVHPAGMPRAVVVIDWLLTLGLVGGSRLIARVKREFSYFKTFSKENHIEHRRVIIIGAGETGSTLVKHMQQHREKGYLPIAFLDDNPLKHGLMIHGVKVVGSTRSIPVILAGYPADEIVLAIPSATSSERRRIAFECRELGVPCKTVPDIGELMGGEDILVQIRDIQFKELLGREEAALELRENMDCYRGRTILITGAAGSIGSELFRQAMALGPLRVIATDISENGLYHLEEETLSWFDGDNGVFETRVMDVRDNRAVERTFKIYRPDIVFHAAAYKHVPMMERHALEAMENNFLGTRTMIEAAGRHGMERFVLVSSDKAVRPTSIMGLSKQLAEQSIRVAEREGGGTIFMAVRFGNVLGSNGSVIPKFKRQISSGKAVTVTHPDITRYFMTIHEAVNLVTQATAMGCGGEIFVLNMGEPVRIIDLARSMIRLCGLKPDSDIPIVFTGLRPGEKLYEELYAKDSVVSGTGHPQIVKVADNFNAAATAVLLNELELITRAADEPRLLDFIRHNFHIHGGRESEYLVSPRIKLISKSEAN